MKLHKYLHEYDFPYHDYLIGNYNFFKNHYLKGINEANKIGSNNVIFYDNPIWEFLNEKLVKIVQENYYVSNYFNHSGIGIYMQDNKNNVLLTHNHIDVSTITGVFYINPPKEEEGGGLKFCPNSLDYPFTIQPKKDKLYLFPSWMMHVPLPQTTQTPRVSLNWGYASGIRPIHKITGDIW